MSGAAEARAAGTAAAGLLGEILAGRRADLAEQMQRRPRAQLEAALAALPPRAPHRFRDALSAAGTSVIAEVKRRAPSSGVLAAGADVASTVGAYEQAGAAAISILTESRHFGGSLADLRSARGATSLPLLRKDFIVSEYQLLEALEAGADAILLIVAALSQRELESLHAQAAALDLDVLVEVHDRGELDRALAAGARIVGVNNRDLRDFSVDLERTFSLLGAMPAAVLTVSESGISEPAQIAGLAAAGVDAVLVGSALMRSGDPGAALAALLRAPGEQRRSAPERAAERGDH